MKTMIKRILSFVVSLCLCINALPIIFGVIADTTEPELSSKCETIIDIAGKDGSFGTTITSLRTSTSVKLSSAINLSNADTFELDVYIKDVDPLKNAITDAQKVQFGFSSNALTNRNNRADADISAQLLQNGWNHIIVNKSDFVINNINWNSVRHVYLRFSNEDLSLSASLQNKVVKIRNICESVAVPTLNDADVVLYDSYLMSGLGETIESPISYVGETFKVDTDITDFTDISLLKADLFISDISVFKTFIEDKELKFVLLSEDGSAVCIFDGIYVANLVSNWYTVQMKLEDFVKDTNFDVSKVTGFKIEVGGNAGEVIGVAYSLSFGFANVRGIKIVSPENSIYGGIMADYISSQQMSSFGETYADFSFEEASEYSALEDAENIEFDLFIDNYESFKNSFLYTKDNTSITASLDLVLSDGTNTITWQGVEKHVNKKGWNHIILPVAEAINQGFDVNKPFSDIALKISGVDTSLENPNFGGIFVVDNFVSTKGIAKIALPEYIDTVVTEDGFSFEYGQGIGTRYDNTTLYTKFSDEDYADVSSSDYIEFDLYLENADLFKGYANNNNPVYLSLYTDGLFGNEAHAAGKRADLAFSSHLDSLKDGWNHIKIKRSTAVTRGQPNSNKVVWSKVSGVAFTTGSANIYPASGKARALIVNVCGTLAEWTLIPDLPDNVVEQINEISGSSLGAYFGYTSDRIFAEGIGPYDFSQCNSIEFDLYVSDYEALKKTFEECPRGEQLALVLSSVPLKLFSQYNKPRTYYSVHCDISDKITKTGWNHIKLGKSDFFTLLGNMNWSNITSYMLRFSKSKFNTSEELEKNPAGEVYVKIANIVNTGILSDVPYDEVQSAKPDKQAIYINDAENLVDDNGSWNPSGVYLDGNFKSENSHSVMRKITYETTSEFSSMFYLFDYSADMCDIKTLKFDLFIDLPQFIQKSGNVLEVGLSSKRNLDGNYTWKINTSTLKKGWNSLSFDVSKALKNGNVSLDEIKTVFVRFNEINLNAEEYESIIIGVDNLRYLSNNGNSTLKINEDIDYSNTITDYELDFDINDSDDAGESIITKTISSEPKTIHLKEIVNKVVTNYTVAIIILCAEFAVLTAASIIAFIILKKKARNRRLLK